MAKASLATTDVTQFTQCDDTLSARRSGGDTTMTVLTHPSGYCIGATTTTTDGQPGTVCALVVDPATRTVTHVGVEPRHRRHRARLVPTEMATAEPGGDVRIACQRDDFDRLAALEQLEIIDIGRYEPYGPYRPYGFDGVGEVASGLHRLAVWMDRPPDGEVALRHGTAVRTTVETVGHVGGLLVGADGRITAVLAASGQLWARRTIAVPIDAVTGVDAGGLTIAGTWDRLRRGS